MPDRISANKRRAALLVAAFGAAVAAVVALCTWVVAGGLAVPAAAVAAAMLAVATGWWWSDSLALAMSHARPADPVNHARLHNLVEGLCAAAGVPKPRVYVVEDESLNAFATGRDPRHAAIVCTTGLLERLTRIELEGVIAHELSHVKSYDVLVSTLAVTMVGAAALVADSALRLLWWGGLRHRDDRRGVARPPAVALGALGSVFVALAPLAGKLMQATVSRRRETEADMSGVCITRYPPGLISALEKLRDGPTVVHSASRATAHLWLESPVARQESEGRLAWLGRLFDTHPPIDERIQALREL